MDNRHTFGKTSKYQSLLHRTIPSSCDNHVFFFEKWCVAWSTGRNTSTNFFHLSRNTKPLRISTCRNNHGLRLKRLVSCLDDKWPFSKICLGKINIDNFCTMMFCLLTYIGHEVWTLNTLW